MDKNYLAAVAKKLKKQGKTEEEVDAFIKNLVNPNKMDEEKKEEEILEPVVESEPTGTEFTPETSEPTASEPVDTPEEPVA